MAKRSRALPLKRSNAMELPEAIDEYAYSADLCEGSPATLRIRINDLTLLCRVWFALHQTPLSPESCTVERAHALIDAIAAQPGKGSAVVDRILQSAQSCWVWLMAEGLATANPFACIPLRRVSERRAAGLANQLLLDVLVDQCRRDATLPQRRLAVVLWLTRAGLRSSEIESCQFDDCDRARGMIHIRNKRGHPRSSGRLPAEAFAAIDVYLAAMPQPPTVSDALIGYRDGADWSWLSVDTMRRHYYVLRSTVVARLRAQAATDPCADGQQRSEWLAATLARATLDDLRT